MRSYRVFISYSHEDLELARAIVRVLEENSLTPYSMATRDRPGIGPTIPAPVPAHGAVDERYRESRRRATDTDRVWVRGP
jgi:hypothetical protein